MRDESLRLKFGINLILTVLDENPDVATPEFADEIRQMILDAVEMEEAYNRDLLPGGILGLNSSRTTAPRIKRSGWRPRTTPCSW